MSENIRQGLMELATKMKVDLEYLIKHLEDDIEYPIT